VLEFLVEKYVQKFTNLLRWREDILTPGEGKKPPFPVKKGG